MERETFPGDKGSTYPVLNNRPEALTYTENQRVNTAMVHVRKLFHPAVADVLCEDLRSYCEFGYRFTNGSRIPKLLDYIFASIEESEQPN